MSASSRQAASLPSAAPAGLPEPGPEARAHSEAVVAAVRDAIAAADGWIGFDRYLDLVLHAPGLGYYAAGTAKFGRASGDGSDFVTAPELTPLFGRTLARVLADARRADGRLDRVLEFGAGTGKLAADVLLALDDAGLAPTTYAILELSADLRVRQRETVATATREAGRPELAERVVWLDAMPSQWTGAILANEVLDAMPVRLFARHDGQWCERGVGRTDAGTLDWRDRPLASADDPRLPEGARALLARVPAGGDYLVEYHEAAAAFVRSLADWLVHGFALLFDYGFPEHEYYHPQRKGGTLMGHYRHHAHHDPFLYPGLSDLTTHVDFTAMAMAGDAAGLTVLGYTSQAHFLLNAGLPALLQALDPTDARRYLPAASGAQKLVSEAEMGELFKVLALGRGIEFMLPAFARGDRTHTL